MQNLIVRDSIQVKTVSQEEELERLSNACSKMLQNICCYWKNVKYYTYATLMLWLVSTDDSEILSLIMSCFPIIETFCL